MSKIFHIPPMSLMGIGCLKDRYDQVVNLSFKKALIVTDKILVDIKLVNKLTALLTERKVEYAIYGGTRPNPTVTNVNERLEILKRENCDFVISFGGGYHTTVQRKSLFLQLSGDLPILAANALKDACGSTNPRQATLEEIIEIFKKSYVK